MKLRNLLTRAILLPIFPAIGTVDAPPTSTEPSNTTAAPGGTGVPPSVLTSPGEQAKPEAKTYTQDEITRMMTAEKEQGRRAILAELGLEDGPKAKEAIAAYLKHVEGQKTELEKVQGAASKAETEKAAALAKAAALENQLTALKLGVSPEYLDDVLALANAKVTETKTFEAVVTEMKAGNYAMFFGGAAAEKDKPLGTGQAPAARKKGDAAAPSTATRLAAQRAAATPVKSHYFGSK